MHCKADQSEGEKCALKPTPASMLTFCILFHLFIAPSRFTLFDLGMRSHECTERGWRSKSVSFSIVFHLVLWNPGSLWAWCLLTDSRANRLVSSRKLSCLWPSRDGTTGTQYHVKIFMWLLGFWMQVAQHALYTESHLSSPPLLILWAPNQSLFLFLFLCDCVFHFCGSRISMARARTLQYSHLNSEIHFSSELAIL